MASNSTNASASGSTRLSEPSSSRRSRTSGGSSGAAAEPEPEPSEVPSTRAAGATTYNVRDYQNPDAGAADLQLSKAAKGKTEDKGKKGGAATVVCFHCGRAALKLMRCGQCHHAHYCGPKVSPMRRVRVNAGSSVCTRSYVASSHYVLSFHTPTISASARTGSATSRRVGRRWGPRRSGRRTRRRGRRRRQRRGGRADAAARWCA